MLPRLAATLTLPFPADSPILHWQQPLRQYRTEQIQFLESLIASWRWHGGALCRDVVENIVSEYVLPGGLKLRQYRALKCGVCGARSYGGGDGGCARGAGRRVSRVAPNSSLRDGNVSNCDDSDAE
jgi:hypothetical protein